MGGSKNSAWQAADSPQASLAACASNLPLSASCALRYADSTLLPATVTRNKG